MRRAVATLVTSLGLIALWAPPAEAASTHAEYIAQADPICQSTEAAERRALGPKGRVLRPMKKGRFKAAAHRYRKSEVAFSGGVDQLGALQPPAADAQVIATWLQMLRAQSPVAKQIAAAMAHGRSLDKLFRRLGSMNVQTRGLMANFGFQYCQNL
ncbi:MAG TPA: hypothetical protein VI028_12605 [Solirubrobacterales bacterium]